MNVNLSNNRLVSDKQLAPLVNVSVQFLRDDRRGERTIPFIRIGRCIRYDIAMVNKALDGMVEGGQPRKRGKRGT
ncbi:MAG: hypothetical protein EBR82_38810 [Caulobacteraceae bacterium]|nr:hypothetical protein [Caulobacteraceae bacterium]